MINVQLIAQSLPFLAHGALISLQIAGFAFIIGSIGGTFLGVCQTRGSSLVNTTIHAFVTLIRGTPMLVQIVFLYYVFSVSGFQLSAFFSAVLAIGINSSAYVSQIIKAGIESVSKGQIEAAQTLGISQKDTLRYIVLPQAIRVVLPALGNEVITLIKDSSLASLIGVAELYKNGQTIISQTYDALSIYVALAFMYLLMTSLAAYTVRLLERRLKIDAHA